MAKKTSKRRSVIMKDKYVSESGVQGGKSIAEYISLLSLIIGIPFLGIGLFAFSSIIFNLGFPIHAAAILAAILITTIGLLMTIGGYFNYKNKH